MCDWIYYIFEQADKRTDGRTWINRLEGLEQKDKYLMGPTAPSSAYYIRLEQSRNSLFCLKVTLILSNFKNWKFIENQTVSQKVFIIIYLLVLFTFYIFKYLIHWQPQYIFIKLTSDFEVYNLAIQRRNGQIGIINGFFLNALLFNLQYIIIITAIKLYYYFLHTLKAHIKPNQAFQLPI